jgi:hypothetical protein
MVRSQIRIFLVFIGICLLNPFVQAQTSRSYPHTLDDQFADVSRIVPAFGGIYIDTDSGS